MRHRLAPIVIAVATLALLHASVAHEGTSSTTRTIGSGDGYSCALTDLGGVVCWGRNDEGQLGNGSTTDSSMPVTVSGLASGVTAISLGSRSACAVTSGGGVKCWGDNTYGQLGIDPSTPSSDVPVDSALTSGVAAVAAGGEFTCALTTGGGVKCWGDNGYGELGIGSVPPYSSTSPVDVSGLASGVTSIAAGEIQACAVTSEGAAECWGSNSQGILGTTTGSDCGSPCAPTPVVPNGLSSGVAAMATATQNSCALMTDDGLKCWGYNGIGMVGDGGSCGNLCTTPQDVSGLSSGVAQVSIGFNTACALLTTGGVDCWGTASNGQRGDGSTGSLDWAYSPVGVSGLSSGVRAIGTGWTHTCVLTGAPGAKCWGKNDHGQLTSTGSDPQATPVDLDQIDTVTDVTKGGGDFTCAIVSGSTQCWGGQRSGELGIGSTNGNYSTPQSVVSLGSPVTSISAGFTHACAVVGGGVDCWGSNGAFALGTGGGGESSTPVGVDNLGAGSGVTAVSAGYQHTCAIISAAAECWGWDQFGQLGDGSNSSSSAFVQVSGLTSDVTAISAANRFTCAVMGGGAYCWGDNTAGQLATDPSVTPASNVPLAIAGLDSNVTAIAAGGTEDAGGAHYQDACAVVSGAVECWGADYGITPVSVVGLSGVTQVAVGGGFGCARTSGGAAKCWGLNHWGQLGNGSYDNAFDPTVYAVSGLSSGVASITAGGSSACAALTTGSAQCWGYSQDGELGNGDTGFFCCTTPSTVLTRHWPAAKFGQAVAFTSAAPGAAAVNDTYAPAASASSGLGVTFGTSGGNCSYDSGSGNVTMLSTGTCTVTADQSGNSSYDAAIEATQSFTIGQGTQTIQFTSTAPSSPVVGDTYDPAATGGGSGNAVTFGTSGGNCTYDGGTGLVTMTHVGTCTVTADQTGSSNYEAATQVTQAFSVAKGPQSVSITSTAPGAATVGDTYTPAASGTDSGIDVTFGTTGGKCTYDSGSGEVTMTHVGTCTVTADQAANDDYDAATTDTQSFTVAKGAQSVAFSTSPPGSPTRGGTYNPAATATSGLTVALGASGDCTYSGGTVTFVHAGSCTVTADQAGDTDWNAAPQGTQTFSVGKAVPTVAVSAVTTVNSSNKSSAHASGTVEAGDSVKLSVSDGTTTAGPFTANVTSGNWSVTGMNLGSLADGTITYTATATDEIAQTADATKTATKDTVAPTATIGATRPANPTNATTAQFGFTADETGSTFSCKLDTAVAAACASPKSYSGLPAGTHTFKVTATDPAGNPSTPATFSWAVDLTAPNTSILTGPAAATKQTTAALSFSSNDTNATFLCKLDTAAFAACTSPKSYSGLTTNAVHVFTVKAKDAAGNIDASPATRQWLVDTVAPTTTIPTAAFTAGTVLGTTVPVTLAWTGTDPARSSGISSYGLQKQTGAGSFTAITLSPVNATSKAIAFTPGTGYGFRVRATDGAGNTGAFSTTGQTHVAVTQQTALAIVFAGTWSNVSSGSASGGSYKQASAAGASATYSFFGPQSVAWVAATGPDRGKADVYLDGAKITTVDLYSATLGYRKLVFARGALTVANHKLKIVATGTKNAASTSARVDVDAFVSVGYRVGSYIYVTSDPNDWVGRGGTYDVTDADGTFTSSVVNSGGTLEGFVNNSAGWNWDLAAVPGQPLTVGTYPNVQDYYHRDNAHAGLAVSAFNRGCGAGLTGSFRVLYASFAGATVNHFRATFVQVCANQGTAALRGEIGFNMPVPAP
jgi:alpha-tubulin suppressor-like RCC1 family protein